MKRFSIKLLPKIIIPILLIILISIFALNQLLTGTLKEFIANVLVQRSIMTTLTTLSREKSDHFKKIEQITLQTAGILENRLNGQHDLSASELNDLFYTFMHRVDDGSYRAYTKNRSERLQMLAFRNNVGTINTIEKQIIVDAFRFFLPYSQALTSTVYNTYFTTNTLIWTFGAHDWPLVVEADENFGKQIWYNSAIPENNPGRNHIWTDMYYDSVNREWMISSLYPVYLKEHFIGVVGHDFILRDIINMGKRGLDPQNKNLLFFLDNEGNVIAHPETQSLLKQHTKNNEILNIKSLSDSLLTYHLQKIRHEEKSGFVFAEGNSSGRLIAYFPLNSIDWNLIYVVEGDFVANLISSINSIHFVSFVLMAFFIITLLTVLLRKIVLKPLQNLILGISNLEKGKLNISIAGGDRQDEFGNVIRAFNHMTKSLNDYSIQLVSANTELRDITHRLQTLTDTTPDAVFIITADGSIIDINKTTCTMFQYSREEILSKNIGELSAENYTQKKFNQKLKAALGKGEEHFEWRIQTYGDKTLPTMVRLKRMQVDDITYVLTVMTDISEQKKAESDLKSSEERFRGVIEQSNDAIYVLYNRRFEIINKKFKEMFGLKLEDVNKNDFDFMDLISSKSRPAIEERMRQFERGESLKPSYEFIALAKDGTEIEVEASVSYIKYQSGVATLGILRDITERKDLEEQLRQSQRLEAIGTLAGGIAHDFNNLLTVINGHAEMGLMKLQEDNPAHRDVTSILRAGKRAGDLTSQLLAFSRKQIYEPQILDINEILIGMKEMIRRLIGEDIGIQIHTSDHIPKIKADPGQVEQILMNLIINARDAILAENSSTKEKLITLKTDSTYYDDKNNHLTNAHHVRISVSDTGIGIPESDKEKIFEPFFTTKPTGKGTGLGLATVYGIVKQNGGDILLDSEVSKGTTLHILWPATQETMKTLHPSEHYHKPSKGNESIMLVEDDSGVRTFAKEALEQLGYHVIEAENGKVALNLLKSNNIKLDLLITDLIMPEMNGKDLASKIKNIRPDLRVLFTSGYTEEHIVKSGELQNGINFLSKPYSLNALAERIRHVLENE